MSSSTSRLATSRFTHYVSRVDIIILAAILLLAAFLRLNRLDLIDVRFDEASAPFLAKGIAQGNLLPIAPFSGSVANHPPLYLYMLALPYLFARNFMAIATYRVLLDVIAIAACWFICRRYFNLRVAVIAALLFAVAPWAIQFSRKLWLAPLPLFSMVLLFGLLEALQRKNPWGWAITGLGLALCVGAHLASLYLVPVVIVALIIGRKTLRLWPCVVGALPLLALAAVYLGFDSRQEFANVRALLGAGASGSGGQFTFDALRFALWGSGGAHLSDLTGKAFPIWQTQLPPIFDLIDTLQMAILLVSLIVLAWSLFRRNTPHSEWKPTISVLLLWLILPILLQLRPMRPLQIHYFIPLYPVPFIVVALGLDLVVRTMRSESMRKVAAWLSGGVIFVIVAWQIFTTLRFTDFIERYDTSNGGYGPPIRSALDVAQGAHEAIRSGEMRDVIVVAPGGDPAVNEPATVMDVLLADVPHRFANADAGLILRDDDAQYIFTPNTRHAFDTLMQHVAPTNVLTRAVPSGKQSYIYARVGETQLSNVKQQSAQWANGVRLIGYSAGEGDPIRLRIYLRVIPAYAGTQREGVDYHYYNHLYRGDEKVGAEDGGGIHPSNWREGDILLHWFDIPRPKEGFDRIRIGTYRYPQVETVMVVDELGNPTADGVDLK